jgi:hypothetical protein
VIIYRDPVEQIREACVVLDRELALYRSFGDTPASAAAAETVAARATLRSFAACLGWLALGVAGSIFLEANEAAQLHGLVRPSAVLFWGATFTIASGMSRAHTVRLQLQRRARTLSFERDELARTLGVQGAGLTATRAELESAIRSLTIALGRADPVLARYRRRSVWLDRLLSLLATGAGVSLAAFVWGIHLSMLGGGIQGVPYFMSGMLGAMACLVIGGAVWLKAREAKRDYHHASDVFTLDRRRLALRTAELPFARRGGE